jgi:hypothetical protein
MTDNGSVKQTRDRVFWKGTCRKTAVQVKHGKYGLYLAISRGYGPEGGVEWSNVTIFPGRDGKSGEQVDLVMEGLAELARLQTEAASAAEAALVERATTVNGQAAAGA